MIKHISLFRFKEEARGRSKEENIGLVIRMLSDFPDKVPGIIDYEVARFAGEAPAVPDGSALMFFDVAQIITFEDTGKAAGYPDSRAHLDLVRFAGPLLLKIGVMDYAV